MQFCVIVDNMPYAMFIDTYLGHLTLPFKCYTLELDGKMAMIYEKE